MPYPEHDDIPSDDDSYAGGDGSDIEDDLIVEGRSMTTGEIFLGVDFQSTNLPNSEFESEDDMVFSAVTSIISTSATNWTIYWMG